MSQNTVVIIDYGSGNLRSAQKSVERMVREEGLSLTVQVSDDAQDVLKAERIILPGQGAFADCMKGLQAVTGMIEALEERVIKGGVPFFGICVGMQLLASKGFEHGETLGLDWIPGQVVPMKLDDPSLKIPHMGWNDIAFPASEAKSAPLHPLLDGIAQGDHFYFVHSYIFECEKNEHILAGTDYGGFVPAIIGRDNIVGAQCHPEKSQAAGLRLIGNFLKWTP